MIGMRFSRRSFFDQKRVKSRADEARERVHKRFGAYVRQRAKTSIRKNRGISTPGSPPSSHTGRIRSGILFAADARSVVIGVVPFPRRGRADMGDLEHGGIVGRMRYRARPFMTPAFEAELKRLPQMWRDQVR